jgi:hypothetical protein
MIIYNSILKMSKEADVKDVKNDMVVKSCPYGSASALLRADLSKFFADINGNKTTLASIIVDKKSDELYYIQNDDFTMMIMVTKPKTMKFSSLKYEQLLSCSILYNFIFKPDSDCVEDNKRGLDLLLAEVSKKHKNIAFVLPVDSVTQKLMHPVMEYFGSKFTAGNVERSIYREFTNLPIKKVTPFEPNLDHYDPIGNVVFF